MGEGGAGTSNNVYIRSDEYAWIPARLVEQDKTTAKVAIPQYANEESIMSDGGKGAIGFKSAIVKLSDYQNHSLPLQNVGKDGTLKELDDMVDLPYLHEVRILREICSSIFFGEYSHRSLSSYSCRVDLGLYCYECLLFCIRCSSVVPR
jgi:hypothetical protein